jgi:transcriptional regulator with XRE-family HTH domain
VPRQYPSDERLARGRVLLGRRLRHLRQDSGLTLPGLVARTGLSIGHLSDVERGMKLLSLPALVAVADVYDVLVVDLLAGVYPYGSATEPEPTSAPPDNG